MHLSDVENYGELSIPTMTAEPRHDVSQKVEQFEIVCLHGKNQATSLETAVNG